MNNIETLRAAFSGFNMEHGVKPSFILMSSDIFRSISMEVAQQPNKYASAVKVFGDRITIDGIEVAQITGTTRVELVIDPTDLKVRMK
jgi:hypothetical protein